MDLLLEKPQPELCSLRSLMQEWLKLHGSLESVSSPSLNELIMFQLGSSTRNDGEEGKVSELKEISKAP